MYDIYESYIEAVTDKDIIIVGPAGCVKRDCKDINVDSYDLVCRINWHWKDFTAGDKCLGQRTDILYHCMNLDQYNDKDIALWKRKGIYLISPYDVSDTTDARKRGATFQERNKGIDFDFICISDYFLKMSEDFGCFLNTGTLAIVHLLSLPVKSVTVVGFDFYETFYWRKENESKRQKIQHGNKSHNVQLQLVNFKKHVADIDTFSRKGRLKAIMDTP
jgi:hypothetical protein